jgi:hypothetical protein
MATQQQRGAVAVGGPDRTHRRRAGWLKWLLPLLLLVGLIALLAALLGGDDNSAGGSNATGAAGTLTAGGASLLPAKAGAFKGHDGQTATGTNVKVVKVNPQEGFWVGTSANQRSYIEYGDVRKDEPKNAYMPKVGDVVNLTGPIRDAPADPVSALNLSDRRDGQLITEQGGFVNAETVKKAD